MKTRRKEVHIARPAPLAAPQAPATRVWVILALAVVGIAVSGYLSVTYLSNAQVACYGLGQCDVVQSSAYSRVFGLPVAVFGLLSYVAIVALAVARLALKGDRGYLALLGILTLSIAGTIFSAYLTYVELLVIQAACPWCLTSAALTLAVAVITWTQVQRELAARRR